MLEMKVPTVGESITEVTVSQWMVEEGDLVEMDDVLCELESDKATFELVAEQAGKVHLMAAEGDDVAVGAVICTIDTSVEVAAGDKAETKLPEAAKKAPQEEQKEPVVKTAPPSEPTSHAAGHPSPAAAKMMQEHQLSPQQIKGTGKGGRITKQDVLEALNAGVAPQQIIAGSRQFSRVERREKMSRLRRTIANHLLKAKNQTAMLTTFNEVDMSAILAIRKQYKETFREKHGVNLGFMSFFTRACCVALQENPAVNAIIDGEEVIYHEFCDISIAVSTPRGLVVPVIRNAESLSMAQLEAAVKELAVKGRDNQLSLEEMEGGTFTISNGGVFGSLMSTPILNAPQSAILGMHKIEERPIAVNGQVVIKPMMYVALSYDHQVIDGKESVTFLVRVKELLEDPAGLLLGADPVEMLLEL